MQVSFGAPFCREVEVPLAELKRLIPLAQNAGVDTTSAQSVYDDLNGYLVYVPLVGNQCEKDTAEANAAVARLQAVMASAGTPPPEPIRPDYTAPTYVVSGGGLTDPDKSLLPTWVKYVAIAGVSAFLLMQVVPLAVLFGGRKKRLAGYGRRKRR